MKKFSNDDRSYRAWLAENPAGFVLNVRGCRDPDYVVLHRASCGSISNDAQASNAFTGRFYRKICAATVGELEEAAKTEGRSDGSFSKRCGLCKP